MTSCFCCIVLLQESYKEIQKTMRCPGLQLLEEILRKRLLLTSGNFGSKRLFTLKYMAPSSLFWEFVILWAWKGPKPKFQSQILRIFGASTHWGLNPVADPTLMAESSSRLQAPQGRRLVVPRKKPTQFDSHVITCPPPRTQVCQESSPVSYKVMTTVCL